MNEPKYAINASGQLYNRVSGKVIPDDEPVFILRASDKNAALAIAYYKKLCNDKDHQAAINNRLHQFVDYAHEHPERMKEPDTGPIETNSAMEGM